jgi:integrase
MRGHIRKYKGRWAGVIELDRDPVTGKRRQKWVYADTERECEKLVNEFIYQVRTGTYIESSKATVEDYLNQWLDVYAKNNLAPSTYRSYKGIATVHLNPRIGNIKLDKLTPMKIQAMYSELLNTHLSPTSVLYIHRILHKALSQAVKWGLLASNPTDKVEAPKKRKVVFGTWDNKTILKALELAKDTPLYIPILLSATTGLRVGEICALRWADMDLDKNQISVRYTYQRVDKQWILKNTKTDGSSRMVILPAVVSNILKKQKQKQKEWQLFHGPDYQLSGFINTWPDGRPIVTEYVGKQFKKFVEENDLPLFDFMIFGIHMQQSC